MKVLVLDTIHGGAVLAEALLRKGCDVDALDVYRGGYLSVDEARERNYDVITAPVHLDPDYPLMKIQEVTSHHRMTGELCGELNIPLVEITGCRGKTTTAFAVAHIFGKNGIIHTSRGTFHDKKLLFRKSITPASLLFARIAAEKEHVDWIVAEESIGVAGCGVLGILTSAGDYKIAAGKKSALAAKLESLAYCKKVIVPSGVPKQDGWVCVDDLVHVEDDRIIYESGEFTNPLIRFNAYRDALKTAACAALVLGKDPSVLSSFEAIEGRMRLTEEDGIVVLDNANSGVNAEITKEAALYLRSVTDKPIYLVIGEEYHAVCDGFPSEAVDAAVSAIQPAGVFCVGRDVSFAAAKAAALSAAKETGGCVLLSVKTWR